MQETTNYKLKKQELTDKADITQISGNWDTIDAELATIDGKTGGTINGDVSIAGALNMSGLIKTTKAEILQTQVDVTKGVAPDSTKYSRISFFDKAGYDPALNRLAHIGYVASADGAATLQFSVNKFDTANGETPASLFVRYQADGTPRVYLSQNPKRESNSQDIATTGWVRQLTATTSEYGLVKLADENAALASTDPLAAVNVPLLYELAEYRRLNTAYNVGDSVGCAFKFDLYLECTQAGTTSGETLDTRTVTHGQTINDGSVIWTVRKAAKSVNGALPDAAGNITISAANVSGAVQSVNTVKPDGAGNVTITAANIGGAVQSVNGVKPDTAGNVTIEQEEVDLSNLVTLNTEQTVTGAKTFSTISVTGATTLQGQTSVASLHNTGETNTVTLIARGLATLNGGVAMSGECTAPTPAADDNSTKIVTTEWVNTLINSSNNTKIGAPDFERAISKSITGYYQNIQSYYMPYDGYVFVTGRTIPSNATNWYISLNAYPSGIEDEGTHIIVGAYSNNSYNNDSSFFNDISGYVFLPKGTLIFCYFNSSSLRATMDFVVIPTK